MQGGIKQAGLKLPDAYPVEWVVDCKEVGSGKQAASTNAGLTFSALVLPSGATSWPACAA